MTTLLYNYEKTKANTDGQDMMNEEQLESLKHTDFKNSKHKSNCKCGYCWMKKNKVPILTNANTKTERMDRKDETN